MKEKLRARCPMCGMIFDLDRLDSDGPYPLELFIQRFGGKLPLSDDEREDRKGKPFKRGSARGFMEYEKIEGEKLEELKLLVDRRVEQLRAQRPGR